MALRQKLLAQLALAAIVACSGGKQSIDASAPAHMPIIPAPARVEAGEGRFVLGPATRVEAAGKDPEARWIAGWLTNLLAAARLHTLSAGDAGKPESTIVLSLDDSAAGIAEGYRLDVRPGSISVTAGNPAGLFYGAVSVWQLATAAAPSNGRVQIPAVHIEDAPRFRWRGLMLDVARHFIEPADMRNMIDWMALHKLNVLHWHLTDDQGWRLEIKRYPRLTDTGAWRIPAGAPRPRYGGYYTQDEVREIVDYASRRHVTIVPEIEMPGHAQAAVAAYPRLGTTGKAPVVSPDWGVHDYLFNVEEDTFSTLENILDEVMAMFPGEYIHIGGDEAVKKQWIASERVQARMKELGVADETALQSYFVRRIEEYLNGHGRRLIGWDEILEGGIAPQATVMSWRGVEGAISAARQGHDTVLSPAPTLYFDHRQSELPGEPPGRGEVISLSDVYAFDPLPDELAPGEQEHVLGLQANLWSEHIRTPERLAYMAFPRAAAVAEIAWSPAEGRSWQDFLGRLTVQFARYRTLGLPFASSAFDVEVSAAYAPGSDQVSVELSNQAGFGDIHFTTDGSTVTPQSPHYRGTLELPATAELSTAVFSNGTVLARTVHDAVGSLATRRFSQQLELCTHKLVLSLEDDAPIDGERSVFLVDIMNPCWLWREAVLSRVADIRVAVGQVPFNFQIGEARANIEIRKPEDPAGELEVLSGGCDGTVVARKSLHDARDNDAVTTLDIRLDEPVKDKADLCFRFDTQSIDPVWVIDAVELHRKPDAGA